jgi:hypothetical protein
MRQQSQRRSRLPVATEEAARRWKWRDFFSAL